MSPTRKPLIMAAVALLAVAIGAYWYWSPYLAMRSMKQAADTRDADTFNQYVDYPKLRENLKGQFNAMLTSKLAAHEPAGDDAFAQAGMVLGTMFGLAFADKMVDAMVRPEVVMQTMEQGKLQGPGAPSMVNPPAANPPADSPLAANHPAAKSDSGPKWSVQRKGFDQVIATRVQDGMTPKQLPAFVFVRSGFASWKLTEIRMPVSE